jgi:DNA-binding NtrC family response regulator
MTRNILLVDDDRQLRASIMRMLWLADDKDRFRVLEAESVQQARDMLRETPISCMLLDHIMPGEKGVESIYSFLEINPDLAIVVITGQGNEDLVVKAMKQGAIDYLVKGSLSTEIVLRTLDNAIERVEMRRKIADQEIKLREAEKQRVMIESLGAVCHHMGQPMTVITTCIELIKSNPDPVIVNSVIDDCKTAVERVNELLASLQAKTFYESEPYITDSVNSRKERQIISVD